MQINVPYHYKAKKKLIPFHLISLFSLKNVIKLQGWRDGTVEWVLY